MNAHYMFSFGWFLLILGADVHLALPLHSEPVTSPSSEKKKVALP